MQDQSVDVYAHQARTRVSDRGDSRFAMRLTSEQYALIRHAAGGGGYRPHQFRRHIPAAQQPTMTTECIIFRSS
jgi:hypothetical protein